MEAKINFMQVKLDVANAANINQRQLHSKTRIQEVVLARFICLWIYRRHIKYGLVECGKRLGTDFDHTTVIHAVKKIDGYLQTEDHYLMHVLENLYQINPEYRHIFNHKQPLTGTQPCHTSPTNLKLKNAVAC